MIVFGPIPSRRLGRSLGINNIPPKACSYSCVYCQVGRTAQTEIERRAFYDPRAIAEAVTGRLERLRARGERIDVLTFVPDGEPTLDSGLGEAIALLKPLGLPVAVITNGTLLWRQEVRRELQAADLVSVKVDTVREAVWRRLNRPHPALRLATVLDGLRSFARTYGGTLLTETMLVAGLNDDPEIVAETAAFVAELRPRTAYLAIPTRPPAEPWCAAPDEAAFAAAFEVFAARYKNVEALTGEGDTDFGFAGDIEAELLEIASVHPIDEAGVQALLRKSGASRELLDDLLDRGLLKRVDHRGRVFYVRRFERPAGPAAPPRP